MAAKPKAGLSRRETEILKYYARGLTDKQIADETSLSLSAVTACGQRLRRALDRYVDHNGNARVQLALLGVAMGYAQLPTDFPSTGDRVQ